MPSPHLTPEELAIARRFALVIEWSDQDQCFLATAPDLPGCTTHGDTREEAATMGEEAIMTVLDPDESLPAGRFSAMRYRVRAEAEPLDIWQGKPDEADVFGWDAEFGEDTNPGPQLAVRVRLSREDFRQIAAAAGASGLSIGEFLCHAALDWVARHPDPQR